MKPIITQADVNDRIRKGESITFLDVRSGQAWAISDVKLPGALRMLPHSPFGPEVKALPRDRTIVTYCSCPHEEDSGQMAVLLGRVGFTSVFALAGGFDAWKEAGLPVEPKEKPAASG